MRVLKVGPQPAHAALGLFGRALHRGIAYLLFAIVVAAVLSGLTYIILHGFGYTFGFVDGWPSIVKH